MEMLSAHMKGRLKVRYDEAVKQLEVITRRLAEAAAFGDLRENAAYESDSNTRRVVLKDLDRIHQQLSLPTAVIKSNVIDIGQLLRVTPLEPKGPEMLLLYESEGDTVLSGVLARDCPLGIACYGADSGRYTVTVFGKQYTYLVEISNDWEEYKRLEAVNEWL